MSSKEIKNRKEYRLFLDTIFNSLINFVIIGKQNIINAELIKTFFNEDFISNFKKNIKKGEMNKLLDDLLKLNYPLQYTNELYQIFISFLTFIAFAPDELLVKGRQKSKTSFIIYYCYHLYTVYLEIKNISKDKRIPDIKDIVIKLMKFFMSDTFILLGIILENINEYNIAFFLSIFIICENIEKYLTIKCLFPLIEELKKSQFETQINKIIQLSKNKKEKNDFIANYYEKHKRTVDYNTLEFKNFVEKTALKYKNIERIECSCEIISNIFFSFFKLDSYSDVKKDKEFLINIFFKSIDFYHRDFQNEIENKRILLNDLMRLNYPLDCTNEIYQLFLFAFNIFLSTDKIKVKLDELKEIICGNIISENYIYIIYQKKNLIDAVQTKYNISYYTKKKVKDNKMSVFLFEKIEKNNNYLNIFNDKEISGDEFNNLKNDDTDANKKNNENKTINENKIMKENMRSNEKEMLNENKNIIENKDNKILNELTEEKNKNKSLEKELKEKNKRIETLENEIKQLKEELNRQININKDNENKLELSKINFDTKDETYKAILDKDKEIKELKEKMKRFPFELNQNEKLISVIFTTSAQEFYYSIICKNTDRFSALEAKLYDRFPQYGETANYFLVNGNKIINHKTLEENHIKDSSIVILYQFEI